MPVKKNSPRCEIFFENARFAKHEDAIREAARIVFSSLRDSKSFFTLYCITNASIAKMNLVHKKKQGPATVFSFPARPDFPHPEVPRGMRYRGEIFMGIDHILKTKREPLARYLAHAILHLVGYTHSRQSDRIEMEALERKLQKRLMKEDAWK
jgi:rRNA maturation RNase YbeY